MTYTAKPSNLQPGAWHVTDGEKTIATCYHDRAEVNARALARLLAVNDTLRELTEARAIRDGIAADDAKEQIEDNLSAFKFYIENAM